ncbi:TPA: hypothetical protein J1246_004841 [Escherichia coli]|nr:hypothetical protein [Escherichia coli]EHK3483732.1 hypothetical protein [Escherichia coli]HBA8089509.1 hypothetical protein [Escherichia coli]HBA8350669.1 hypothetical protein [Escherichia coli]HBA8915664.1 hypothetical protein [Escherichia coli]
MAHTYIDSSIPTSKIINCISRSIQESGYIMELNGTKPPINATEFATYKMSKFTGSFWIENSTEGRPSREAGVMNATQEDYKILNDALQSCGNTLTNY